MAIAKVNALDERDMSLPWKNAVYSRRPVCKQILVLTRRDNSFMWFKFRSCKKVYTLWKGLPQQWPWEEWVLEFL